MEIELLEQAITEIAEYNPVAAGLAELKRKYGNIAVDVSTPKALDEAKRVRAEIREPRYETEKIRKALKAPALAHAKLIDTEAARITAELLAIETPWDDAIKAEETRKEAEKAAREAAERSRIMAITERIVGIRQYIELAASCRTAARIHELQEKLARISLDGFDEFTDEATAAHADAMKRVEALLVEKHLAEQEQERIRAEQAAKEAALKAEREAFAAEQAKAKAEADRLASERLAQIAIEVEAQAAAKAAAQAELDAQRAQLAAAKAELDARIKAEQDRHAEVVAQEQAKLDAEWAAKAEADRSEALREQEKLDAEWAAKQAEEQTAKLSAEIEAQPTPDQRDESAMWVAITNAEPSDADVVWTCIKACSDEYGWTTEQATKRLAAITYL